MNPVAKVIEDSISEDGIRATTLLVRYPRMIHAEMMTHKFFARNGRSSRAVPVMTLLREDIVEPLFYGANKPGMSAGDTLKGWRLLLARGTWLGLAKLTKLAVRTLHFAGLHKQWANRPLEWFGCIDLLITSTQWNNFFELRIHDAAQPEIRELAIAIRYALTFSKPRKIKDGDWHLPFVSEGERATVPIEELKKISTARCARLTFAPPEEAAGLKTETQYMAEYARYQKLMLTRPVHASPAEHVLTPDKKVGRGGSRRWTRGHMHGCTPGWVQHRHEVPYHFIPG